MEPIVSLFGRSLRQMIAAADEQGSGGDSIIGQILHQLGVDFQIVIIQIVGFLLLLMLLRKFLWGPAQAMLEQRRADISSTYDKLEEDKRQMEQLRSEYEQRLAQIESEARTKIQEALSEANAMREQITNDARRQGEELVARAQEQANLEREKALTELQTYVTDLTLAATERVLGENMNNERQRKLIQEFIENAEVR
ncbi:MAG: F0F1 ATP synthase subunit B [Fimbriimonadia bacterium]|nr:F0F1 ATP synthase subunit B [Fimbriimonadia bacterium]